MKNPVLSEEMGSALTLGAGALLIGVGAWLFLRQLARNAILSLPPAPSPTPPRTP